MRTSYLLESCWKTNPFFNIEGKMRHKFLSFVIAVCLLFPILTALSMLFYPGGTLDDPSTSGYRFFENYFSELGLSQSYAGGPQTASFLLFTTALTLAGMALAAYFIIAPSLFWERRTFRLFSLVGSIFGVLSGLSFIGVAFSPADLYLAPHSLFVQLAFMTFFVAAVFYTPAFFLHPGFPNLYGWVDLSFGVLLGIYVWLLFYGPGSGTRSGLIIQVTGQKIIAYAAVTSIFIMAYGSQRYLDETAQDDKPVELEANQVASS